MANFSSARKLTLLARVAAQQAGRTRTGNAIFKGVKATASHVAQVVRQLWLEVTGFVFLCIGTIGGIAVVREYSRYRAAEIGPNRTIGAIIFTAVFVWFGLTSFWRVRKKPTNK